MSTLAELHAVEEALLSAPSGVNLCITTNSWAAISSITNWHMWSDGRRCKFTGEAVMCHIHLHTQALAAKGNMVTYQHLYSHIPEKKHQAQAVGSVELAKLKHKLHSMKDHLWGSHSHWINSDASCSSEGGCMANFLHKARYGALPMRAMHHHFYWR